MRSRATLRLPFGDPAQADAMLRSLAPENGPYLAARVEGSTLVLEAEAATPLSLLHTLDDALACLSAAEKASRVGAGE